MQLTYMVQLHCYFIFIIFIQPYTHPGNCNAIRLCVTFPKLCPLVYVYVLYAMLYVYGVFLYAMQLEHMYAAIAECYLSNNIVQFYYLHCARHTKL